MGMDPVGVSDANIHSHNRYAYGNNNPYKFTDPDGNSPIDIGFFAKDVGNLLVQEIVYGAALVNGNDGVASLAMEGMSEGVTDAAISTVGMINPVPGTGSAMKAAAKAEKVVGSYTVKLENGMKYHGKGTEERMAQSIKRLEKDFGPVDKNASDFKRSANNREAFKDEARRIRQDGGIGKGIERNHNQRNSPGEKYLRQDGQ